MTLRPSIEAFFDPSTGTVSYIVWDHPTRRAAVIDPVLDYDFRSGHTGTASIDRLLAHLSAHALQVDWILEAHAHADHLSGARQLQERVGGRIAIRRRICTVQATFKALYNLEPGFLPDGSQFDHLFDDGETLRIGETHATALFVPGHTPADMASGRGRGLRRQHAVHARRRHRADRLPGRRRSRLYASIRRLLRLPPATRLDVGHDYPPSTRQPAWTATVAAQRAHNIHVRDGIDEDAFVALRRARDATLGAPTLILPAIQVNVRAGRLPPPDDNGIASLRIPLNALPVGH